MRKRRGLKLEMAIRDHDPEVFAGGGPLESRKGLVGAKAPSFNFLSLRIDNPTRMFVDDVLCREVVRVSCKNIQHLIRAKLLNQGAKKKELACQERVYTLVLCQPWFPPTRWPLGLQDIFGLMM